MTFSTLLSTENGASGIIFSVSLMLFSGFLMTRITKRLRLPSVTAYILAGILIGPYALRLVPEEIVSGMDFISDIALAFIAFGTGEFFRLDVLRRNGAKVVIITLAEMLASALLVFSVSFFILKIGLPLSIVLASLATVTAPTSTVMTIRQTGAKGPFVDTLLQTIALDDMLGLLFYSIAISVAVGTSVGGLRASDVFIPILSNLGALLIGCLFGLVLGFLISKRSNDNKLIITVALLFTFCGICTLFGVSPLLGCMSMGTVYVNTTRDDKLFKQISYFSPPILLLFFVRSGLSFDLGALVAPGGFGSTPLLLVGIVYFVVRIVGKYLGALGGAVLAKKEKRIQRSLGLALIPQASVAIGLATLGARSLGTEMGSALLTITLCAGVLCEIIGPAVAKLALSLSGAYSEKLEDLVDVSELDDEGRRKSHVELLTERIGKIREELSSKRGAPSEEELAFTEAAEAHYKTLSHDPRRRRRLK